MAAVLSAMAPLRAAPPGGEPITAVDADGRVWALNKPGRVLVVIGNDPGTSREARDCGKALDEFQGRSDFRAVVLVDLRGYPAGIAPGYTRRRMQKDLDAEALRVAPFYRKNGNPGDPRRDIGAIPDFDGAVCARLGWGPRQEGLRVVVFGWDGREAARWDNRASPRAVRDRVIELLAGRPPPKRDGS